MQGRSSRGHERVTESWSRGSGKRGGDGRAKKGGKQREKAASVSPRLAAFYSIEQELACAGHGWKKQTDSGVSLPQRIW